MRRAAILAVAAVVFTAAWAKKPPTMPVQPAYPETRVEVVTDDYFGTKVEDPYRWLEDGASPEVQKWAQAQDAFTRARLEAVPGRDRIVQRLTELWNYPRMSVPQEQGPYLFFTRNDGLQNQSPLFVQEGEKGAPRLLLDPNTLSADGTVAVDWWYPSEKGAYVAYGTSEGGSEQSTLRVRRTASGQDLPDVIPGCRFSAVAWLPDESGFYYTRFPKPGTVPASEINYHHKVMFHRLGADPDGDALVFAVPAQKELLFRIALSNDARHLLITASQGSDRRREVYVKDLVTGAFLQIAKGFTAAYSGEIADGVFYCLTDEGAPLGKVVAIDLANPSRENWKVLVPESGDTLEDVQVCGGLLVVEAMHDAAGVVRLFTKEGAPEREVPLPTLPSVSGLHGRWDLGHLYLGVASFVRPPAVLRYELASGALSTVFQPAYPAELNTYEAEQVWYPSKDGTKVSMFLVHKKGMKRDGQNPTFLTAYGGFKVSMTPYFSPVTLWWLEQGGLFALPNLRGGGEYGEAWHAAGMREKKQNVFDDFVAAAEYLVRERWTSTPKLAVEGGSNGGLLTGACLTQRPDLYGAVVVAVPLLDMLRFHRFSIARYWVPEYGSSETPEGFGYLSAYSPYQNVRRGVAYPPTLIETGANDSRVDPLHARKMAALLQARTAGPAPILLRVEGKAGHGQGKPTTMRIEAAADTYAFLVEALGMKVTKPRGQ